MFHGRVSLPEGKVPKQPTTGICSMNSTSSHECNLCETSFPKQKNLPETNITLEMGVSKNSGTPKWMIIMENPIKIDDLGIPIPLFLETSK